MADIRRMQIAQLVDFCIDFNERQKRAEGDKNGKTRRRATQADINAFFG